MIIRMELNHGCRIRIYESIRIRVNQPHMPRPASSTLEIEYCKLDWDATGASGPRGGRARDFVNFRGKKYASPPARD